MTYLNKMSLAIMTFLVAASGAEAHDQYQGGFSSYQQNGNYACCEPICCEPVCCEQGFISADLLYWRAFQSGIENCVPFTISDSITSDGNVISRFSAKARNPHFKWHPGVRIGAGYKLPCNWEVAAYWTHFHSHSNDSGNNGNRFRWKLDFDTLDVIGRYEACVSSCFTLRPFAGLRFASIDQHVRRREFPNSTIFGRDLSELVSIANKQKFSGMGPLVGLEGSWNLWCDFSLYANGAISWMYGNFNTLYRDQSQSSNIINSSRVRNRLNATVMAADASIGIRWQRCVYKNMRLLLQVGLEHHRYFDYNRLGNYGDLSFDGVNFSAGLAF